MVSNWSAMFGIVVVVVMVILSGGAMAQSGCRSAIVSLSPCIEYVSGNLSSPSHSCCSQLTNVISSQPRCLCALVSGDHTTTGFHINETVALGLPDDCNIQAPPLSRCDGNGSQTVQLTSEGTTIHFPFYILKEDDEHKAQFNVKECFSIEGCKHPLFGRGKLSLKKWQELRLWGSLGGCKY
nr:non-specific lipid-transfer protein-like protein At2g13820 [Tanacetum cinerariifolium]